MDDLLITKLSAPLPRHRLVSRDRLLDLLNREGLHSRLLLISAPAGFGKTTLLSAWRSANADQCNVAWVALDEYDDTDPARFWRHVIASVENAIGKKMAEAHVALQNAMPQIQSALAGLINVITGTHHPLMIVLDEYQWITAPAVHESVSYLLEHLPAHAHVALLTRADPPFGLARLRVRGELFELRAAQLRFTLDETRAFLREVMGIDLSDEALDVVQTRTEGWPATVHLAALVAKGDSPADVSARLTTLLQADEFIFDYLAEEVIRQQPPAVQHFLKHTCVLSHLCAPLCDAMTGNQDAALMLSRLQHIDFFISPLGGEGGWYRYHPLFAQALQTMLKQQSPALLHELHRRASDWHYEHEHLFEAIRHAQAIEDNERITRYISGAYRRLIMQGDIVTLMRLLDALPQDMVRSHARLAIAYAWSHIYAMQFSKLERYLGLAMSAVEGNESAEARQVRAEVMSLRAVYESVYGDADRAMALSHEAQAIADTNDALLQMVLGVSYGNAYRARGRVNEALRAYEATVRIGQDEGHFTLASLGEVRLCQMLIAGGRLHEAKARLEKIVASRLSIRGEPVLFTAETMISLGGICYELDELDCANNFVEQGIEAADITNNSVALIYNAVPVMQTLLACRSQTEAHAFLDRIVDLASRMQSPAPVAIAQAHRAWFHCAIGRPEQAKAWAQCYADTEGRTALLPLFRDEGDQTLARIYMTQGWLKQAERLLGSLIEVAQTEGRARTVMTARVQLTVLLDKAGQREAARAEVLRAVAMAEDEGCIRSFVDWGEPMRKLLLAVRGRAGDVLHDYIERVLDAFPLDHRGADELIEPLTSREVEILQLLAGGCTNADIAGRLIISTGTVKAHTNRIFGKLGVRNRTEAAARARELHLLKNARASHH